ncbi:hypothetical protein [Viridibacillus arvi]|uniref:Uncharacterized protein n=1 Tax=Viridibacillus arvi TaxID=263475 RepID=A0A0M0LKN0_9BACL|nr:hypothetical protein [Viridibacillus arvi]KOO51546.1 hypothetical protein AMD00_03510 [Viridibacillus arvi]
MKKQYFVQYSHDSIINDFSLPNEMFKSIVVGIVYIFFGQGLSEGNLVPTSNWDKPIEFKTLDFEKVDTFIDVHEVGLTIFSDNDKYNSPRKVTDYISKAYLLDIENSDI